MKSLFDISEFEKRNPRTKKGCLSCPLKGGSLFKKVGSWGIGEKGIAIVTSYPKNKFHPHPLTQNEQNLLEEEFDKFGIDLYNDCKTFNLVRCALKDDDQLNASLLQCCSYYTEKELEEFCPKIIVAFGDEVINWFLSDSGRKLSAYRTFGKIVPSQKWDTPVLCSYNFNRFFGNNAIDVSYLNAIVKKTANFVRKGKEFKKPLDRNSYVLVDGTRKFDEMLEDISCGIPVAFDYETNGLEPFEEGYKILTAAFAVEEDKGYCLPLDHKDSKWSKEDTEKHKTWLKNWLKSNTKKVIQNWAFEELVSRTILGTKINKVVLDSMILQHLIDNRKGICSQDHQIYVRYGDSYKDMVDPGDLENTDLNLVAEYNALDVRYLKRWAKDLEVEAQGFPGIWQAYEIFHKAIPTFVMAKINGVKIDLKKFGELEEQTLKTIDEYSNLLNNSNYVKEFEKKYGKKFNVRSPQHKQEILYDIIGLDTHRLTDGGYKRRDNGVNYEPTIYDKGTDKNVLAEIQGELKKKSGEWKFIDAILNIQKYNKLYSTYIKGIKKTIYDGKIHPSYLLHTASSFRSGSRGPNFQNIPIHDPILSTVRESIVPVNDYFLSVDYSQNEVRYIAALSGDENLIHEVNNGVDFHKKFAAILLRKDENDVTTKERYDGKNGFVFPEFYGSNAKVISRKMGYDLMRVIKAERMFWERYKGVKEFNERKAEEYRKKFRIRTPLGFHYLWGVGGPLTDENLLNSDIQGTAFHRLLKAWNDICEDIEKNDILQDSFIVGQIHDSIVFDVTEEEIVAIAKLCQKHMCNLDVWGQWDKRVIKAVDFEVGKDFRKGEEYSLEKLIEKFEKVA